MTLRISCYPEVSALENSSLSHAVREVSVNTVNEGGP